MVLMSVVFFTQEPCSPFRRKSGKMTKGGVALRHEVTLLPVLCAARWDLDRTVVRSALPLVCTGVRMGIGGVLRWLGGGSFWRLDLEERSSGISLHSGEETISRSSCGGDFRGETEVAVPGACGSGAAGALACVPVPEEGAVLPHDAAGAGWLGEREGPAVDGGAPSAAGWAPLPPEGEEQLSSTDTTLASGAKGLVTEKV